MKWKRNLAWLLLAASVCIMAWCGRELWNIQNMYARGDRAYEELLQAVTAPPEAPNAEAPDRTVDFEKLQAINPDAVAWLYGPGTAIDYPVMRAEDYNQYLRHLPDGTYHANGSLFLDYNNPSDFSGRLNIIYGHNMKSEKMFGTLEQYKKQAYYEAHPCLYLDTLWGDYRVDLLYGCGIAAGQWRDRAFMYEANLESLLDYAAYHTTFDSRAACSQEDRILVLSTCSYDFDDARYFVVGVLRPRDEAAAP